jgi:myo-inositol-1(or 4)-monophosphatase
VTATLSLAEEVAREAGAQLREAFARGAGVRLATGTKSTPTDLVSEADLRTEELIRSRLQRARPEDGLLGEEGSDTVGTSGRRWVVDPLDGTVNFLFGIPQWAVSVACEDEQGTLAGVVYDPVRDQLWAAARDEQATLDGAPLPPPPERDLATALIATGFGYDGQVRARQAAVVARLLPEVRDIRRLGSAALDLAWTAGGRYDAYFERGINHWDVAAGRLICERAGLIARPLAPDPPAGSGLLVARPALADALAPLLAV